MKLEAKVGMFFIIGLILLAVVTFRLSDFRTFFLARYELHGKVQHAAGLLNGDTVAVAGVKIGTVKELKLQPDGVDVVMLIDKASHIHNDSVGVIAWSGLLGDRYVDITFGSTNAPYLKPGESVQMKEAFRPELLIDKFDGVVAEIHDFLGGTSTTGFKTLPDKFDKALAAITEVTDDLKSGKGTLGKLLTSDETQQKLEAAFKSVQEAADQVRDIGKKNSDSIDKAIASLGDIGPQLKDAVNNINGLVKDVKEGKGTLSKLISDEKMAKDLDDTIASLKTFSDGLHNGEGLLGRLSNDKKLSDDVTTAIDNLKEVSAKLQKGEGTLGKLLTDEQAYNEFQKLMADARDLLRGLKEQIPIGSFGSAISSAF